MSLSYRETKGYKYVVAARYSVAVPEMGDAVVEHPWFNLNAGVLTVAPGYAWDGASGPTIDTKATIEASLPHDVFFQSIRAGLLPASAFDPANRILRRMMLEAPGNPTWVKIRAGYFYHAVRLFGKGSTRARAIEPQDKVYST